MVPHQVEGSGLERQARSQVIQDAGSHPESNGEPQKDFRERNDMTRVAY